MDDVTQVKLMPEYGCDFPVWIDHDEAAPTAIADPSLRARIEAWNAIFLCGFDAERGWRDNAERKWFAELGRELAYDLQQHFGPSVHVTYDAWPLGPGGQS